MKSHKRSPLPWIVVCLILLASPNLHIIDLLPDTAAWIIIRCKLSRPSLLCPHFPEAKRDAGRLALLTFAKIPALLLVRGIQSVNVGDRSIVTLCTFAFGVAEFLLLIRFNISLFDAFFYLGERTDASALISPFRLADGTRYTPEQLRTLTAVFFGVKSICSFAPTFFLLRNDGYDPDFSGAAVLRTYNISLVCFAAIALCVGVIWCFRFYAWAKTVCAGGGFAVPLAQMEQNADASAVAAESERRTLFACLSAVQYGALLFLPMCFGNFGGVDIFPGFLFGTVLTVAWVVLNRKRISTRAPWIAGCVYCAVSLLAFSCTVEFSDRFGFSALVNNAEARRQFLIPQIASCAESVAFVVLAVFTAIALNRMISDRRKVESDPSDRVGRDHLFRMKFMTWSYAAFACFCSVAKTVALCLKASVSNVSIKNPLQPQAVVLTPLLPWFSTATFLLCVAFVLFSVMYFSVLKSEIGLQKETDM